MRVFPTRRDFRRVSLAKELPMATVKVSSQIAAPVERVFQMFTDIEHGAEHVTNIKKIETLTTGPFSLGTRWQETRAPTTQRWKSRPSS